jgi:hypothetical protein
MLVSRPLLDDSFTVYNHAHAPMAVCKDHPLIYNKNTLMATNVMYVRANRCCCMVDG